MDRIFGLEEDFDADGAKVQMHPTGRERRNFALILQRKREYFDIVKLAELGECQEHDPTVSINCVDELGEGEGKQKPYNKGI